MAARRLTANVVVPKESAGAGVASSGVRLTERLVAVKY
jgi:hypothetical protein